MISKCLNNKAYPQRKCNKSHGRPWLYCFSWEQRKVGEVIEDYVEKTTVQNQYPVLTSSQQQGIVLQEDYFADRQVTTNDNVGYYVLPRGFFTYRSRSDTDLFVFNRNNLIDKGIISYYYPVFRPKNTDSNFLLRRLNHGIRSQLSMAAEGTGQHVLAHAVIGLPANIFFGTGIPTIIMVLKQKRDRTDVLIVDASKGFEKVGKNNKLRASDIKRITDVVSKRITVDKFSRTVSRDEIRANDYNLNILNISRRQAYTLFAKPDFPKIRIGNRYCVRKDRFYSWIEAQAKEDKNEKEKQDQSK